MTNEELATAIVSELTLAYIQAGSHISADNALQVAKSYCEEMDFRDLTEVHEAFRRAKTVADIPTQRTLSEALKNYRAETLTPMKTRIDPPPRHSPIQGRTDASGSPMTSTMSSCRKSGTSERRTS